SSRDRTCAEDQAREIERSQTAPAIAQPATEAGAERHSKQRGGKCGSEYRPVDSPFLEDERGDDRQRLEVDSLDHQDDQCRPDYQPLEWPERPVGDGRAEWALHFRTPLSGPPLPVPGRSDPDQSMANRRVCNRSCTCRRKRGKLGGLERWSLVTQFERCA